MVIVIASVGKDDSSLKGYRKNTEGDGLLRKLNQTLKKFRLWGCGTLLAITLQKFPQTPL
jgi:hypothetical protein